MAADAGGCSADADARPFKMAKLSVVVFIAMANAIAGVRHAGLQAGAAAAGSSPPFEPTDPMGLHNYDEEQERTTMQGKSSVGVRPGLYGTLVNVLNYVQISSCWRSRRGRYCLVPSATHYLTIALPFMSLHGMAWRQLQHWWRRRGTRWRSTLSPQRMATSLGFTASHTA